MIFRPLNIAGFLAAALAGLHLYSTKHEAALLDRELRSIAREIDAANERTQALAAEWAWLNEPERLRAVAQRHLSLEPMQPTQFLRLNEAERRAPAAIAYAGPPALFAARAEDVPEGESVTVALLPRLPPPVQVARTEPAAPAEAPAAGAEAAAVPAPAPLASLPVPPPPPPPPVQLALPAATP
ncbi:cell division protein FtsL, partial [Siccirubricoccus phaeus]